MLTSCSPDDYSLGSKDLTTDDLTVGIAYDIVPDASNPNIINLVSKLPSSYQVLWEHPQGRAQSPTVTLNIPFAGTYTVRMGVETRGGVVYGPEAQFTVDQFCADFVTDELWTYISGGVGHSKKWYIDLDANGVSRYFAGPLYFKGTDDCWESVTLGQTLPEGSDSWSWDAGYDGIASWQWGTPPTDYGYMEFDLNGGSNVHVVMNEVGKEFTGKFMLDVANHTIAFTDAELLHSSMNDGAVNAWNGTLKLLSLTENTMQIAVVRTNDPCILCHNFISEDYYNSWTPESTGDTDVLPGIVDPASDSYMADWRDYVEPKTQQQVTYRLVADDTPFDWVNLDGTNRGVTMEAAGGIEDLTLAFDRSNNSYVCTAPDGTEVKGTYTLTDDGVYTFSAGLPEVQLSANGLAVFKANADNTLRITGAEVDSYSGAVAALWLGSQNVDDQGNLYQYCGYHFKPVSAGGEVVTYSAVLYTADNSNYTFTNSDPVYVAATGGEYTLTVSGSRDDITIVYLQVDKLLKDNPNADIIVKKIVCDGNEVPFDDGEKILRCVDDGQDATAKFNARRYFCNPWNAEGTMDPTQFRYTSTLAITIQVVMDAGEIKIQ